MGIECSALKSSNVSEIIYCAQKVVLFPLAPLYDFHEKVILSILFYLFFLQNLTPEFRRALTRIFRICDKDGDTLLKDNELIEIQSDVFKGELTQGDIKGIKDVIKDDVNKTKQKNKIKKFFN